MILLHEFGNDRGEASLLIGSEVAAGHAPKRGWRFDLTVSQGCDRWFTGLPGGHNHMGGVCHCSECCGLGQGVGLRALAKAVHSALNGLYEAL